MPHAFSARRTAHSEQLKNARTYPTPPLHLELCMPAQNSSTQKIEEPSPDTRTPKMSQRC
eukprot:191502-Amphidinium_carterae.1